MNKLKGLIRIIRNIIIFIIGIVLMLFFLQHKLIYHPRSYDSSYDSLKPKHIVELHYENQEGSQVGFYIPPKSEMSIPENLWILFSGNASLALDWSDLVKNFPDQNTGFLLVDYPGYGKCEGIAKPLTILNSSEKAFLELSQYLSVPLTELENKLNILGHSLGTGTGLQFASKHKVNRIVLISPFTSLKDMAVLVVGRFLSRFLLHNYDNRARIAEVLRHENPPSIYIIHGDNDNVVPVEMGRELSNIYKNNINYLEVKGGNHNGILNSAQSIIYNSMLDKIKPSKRGTLNF